MVVARGWGREMASLGNMEFQFYKMKSILEMDIGDSCTIYEYINTIELYI